MKKKTALILFVFFVICRAYAQIGWVQRANLPGALRDQTSTFTINNIAYVGCGQGAGLYKDFYAYNPTTNVWTAIPNYPGSGSAGNSCFAIEGKGYVGMGNDLGFYKDLWCYDPILNTWTAKASNPNSQGFYSSASFVIGHKAWLVCISYGGPPYHPIVWMYDAHTNTWTLKNNFPGGAVEGLVAFAIGNNGYAGCGWDGTNGHTAMYEYDTTNDTWTSIATFPGSPVGQGLTGGPQTSYVIGSKAYVCYGQNGAGGYALPVGWVYDTVTKAWCGFSHLGTLARAYASSFVLNGKGYICDGSDTNGSIVGPFVNTLYEYDPVSTFTLQDSSVCSTKFSGITTLDTTESVTWDWTFTGGTPATSSVQYPTVTYASAGSYPVQLIVSSCGGSDTVIRNVQIDPVNFPVTVLANPPTICNGSTSTLSATGGVSYLWSTGATTSSVSVNPHATTLYTVGISNGTCMKDTSVSITVNPLPVVTLSPPPSICAGSSTTLTASGGSSYLWSTGSTATSINVNPTSTTTYTIGVGNGTCTKDTSITVTVNNPPSVILSPPPTICAGSLTTLTASGGTGYSWSTGATTTSINESPNTTITYSVHVTNGTCFKDTSIKVTVNPLPIVTLSPSPIICAGTTTSLSAGGGISYLWSTAATTSAINVTPGSTITYTVGVSNGTCTKDTSIKVTVNPLPSVTLSPAPNICIGSQATLTASGGISYLWSTNATTSSITVTPTITTTYTLAVNNGTCTKDTSIVVTVNNPPVVTLSPSPTICAGHSAILTASGGTSYNWSTGSTTTSINVAPNTTTTYTLRVNNGSCFKDTSITVNVNPLPVVNVNHLAEVCSGDTVTLTATGGGPYKWSTGATTSSIKVFPTTTTNYTVVVNNGCIDSAVATVPVDLANTLNVCCDAIIQMGESVTLNASGTPSYLWSPAAGLSCTTCPDPIASPTVTTVYTVSYKDNIGCPENDTVTVFIEAPCNDFVVPNIFTPNNDGINDDFVIRALNTSAYSVVIYDRWGKEMYSSSNPGEYWNGNINNGSYAAPDGVYYYIVKATCGSNNYLKKGYVQVLR